MLNCELDLSPNPSYQSYVNKMGLIEVTKSKSPSAPTLKLWIHS